MTIRKRAKHARKWMAEDIPGPFSNACDTRTLYSKRIRGPVENIDWATQLQIENENALRKHSTKSPPLPPSLPLTCFEHKTRQPDLSDEGDIMGCDWKRSDNPTLWNGFNKDFTRCKTPYCENCIARETYGEFSAWALTAPPGISAEEHRLQCRLRYLCDSCPFPDLPQRCKPGETCSCELRGEDGKPTDIWFQCRNCAQATWFRHDSRYRTRNVSEGLEVKYKPSKKRNKQGIWVQPRSKSRIIFKCTCNRWVSKERQKVVCTWCCLPVKAQ